MKQAFPFIRLRGGQTTYHGPGQRIIYLLLDLRDGKRYKTISLEHRRVAYLVLKELGLSGYRIPGLVGVWVKDPKNINTDGSEIKNSCTRIKRLKKVGNIPWPFVQRGS